MIKKSNVKYVTLKIDRRYKLLSPHLCKALSKCTLILYQMLGVHYTTFVSILQSVKKKI